MSSMQTSAGDQARDGSDMSGLTRATEDQRGHLESSSLLMTLGLLPFEQLQELG